MQSYLDILVNLKATEPISKMYGVGLHDWSTDLLTKVEENNVQKKTLSLAVCVLLLGSVPIFGDQTVLEVDEFTSIEIGTGIYTEVTCGSENKVIIEADKKTLKNINVEINNGILEVSRKFSTSKLFNNIFGKDDNRQSSVSVEVITTSQLSSLVASTGSSLEVKGCAVDSSQVTIEAGTGATVDVEGSTASLRLELSTGALFNRRSSEFSVDEARVDLSTGAIANLCGASTVRGDASTGAVVRANSNADVDRIDLSFGAEVSTSRCK